jgi:hypothetical protein
VPFDVSEGGQLVTTRQWIGIGIIVVAVVLAFVLYTGLYITGGDVSPMD